MGEKFVWGGVVEGKFRLWIWISNCSVRMKAPRAQGENLKIQPPRGLGGYPKFFFTPNLILFVSINSVQNFKTVAIPLLGEKFVVGGGGGGGWWCKPILVLSFGQAEQNSFPVPSFEGNEPWYRNQWSSL